VKRKKDIVTEITILLGAFSLLVYLAMKFTCPGE